MPWRDGHPLLTGHTRSVGIGITEKTRRHFGDLITVILYTQSLFQFPKGRNTYTYQVLQR